MKDSPRNGEQVMSAMKKVIEDAFDNLELKETFLTSLTESLIATTMGFCNFTEHVTDVEIEVKFSPAHSEQAEGRFNRQTNWRTEKNK